MVKIEQNDLNVPIYKPFYKFLKHINKHKNIFIKCLEVVPWTIHYHTFIEHDIHDFSDLLLTPILKEICRSDQTQICELGVSFYLDVMNDFILFDCLKNCKSNSIYHIYFDREPEFFHQYLDKGDSVSFIERREKLIALNNSLTMITYSLNHYDMISKEIKNSIILKNNENDQDHYSHYILPMLSIIVDYLHILHQDISLQSFYEDNLLLFHSNKNDHNHNLKLINGLINEFLNENSHAIYLF